MVRSIAFTAVLLWAVLSFTVKGTAQQATLILVHGKVWTENPHQPEAEAVAMDGERILAVGTSSEMLKLAGKGTQVIDIHGRRVLPGFNDAHVHFMDGSFSLRAVNAIHTKTPEEFRDMLGRFARTLPKGEWIADGAWDHENWPGGHLPTHQLIDPVTPDNPVAIPRLDGHMLLANAKAMEIAGITKNTPDVPGGVIVRDAEGNPTGIFKDAAENLIASHIPAPSPERMRSALDEGLRYAAEHGVTSVQEMANDARETLPGNLRTYEEAQREGKLTVRIAQFPGLYTWKNQANLGIQAGFGSPSLRLGGLKAFADGSLGSTTAWLFAPYKDAPNTSGIASDTLLHPEEMYANMKAADAAHLQIAIHAIGDRANHTILDMYERLEKENPTWDRRVRIEHAQHLIPSDIPRFAKLHVIASMQPYHAIDDGRWAEKRLGPERLKTSYAWRSLLDSGATLAFGSDWPVAPMDPLMGIYAAATRRTLDGKNPNGWIPAQKITVAEAIHAYTIGSAYAEYQEKVKGSIESGKLADLIVLSDDILHENPVLIEKTRVMMTIFGGKVIYDRERSKE
ncbi:MAG TPA: amidohydrolase [Edaphobacter sp.]|nr:amidohydrolase [Edaphobacter sp.]